MQRSWAMALVVVSALGCSSGFDSGVQGDKRLSDVTAEESERMCYAYADYLDGLLPPSVRREQLCVVQALQATVTPEACRAAVQSCLASSPTDPISFDCEGAGIVASCDATVDQAELCVQVDTELYASFFLRPSCDVAGNIPELMRLRTPPDVPAQCTALRASCPELGDGFFPRS